MARRSREAALNAFAGRIALLDVTHERLEEIRQLAQLSSRTYSDSVLRADQKRIVKLLIDELTRLDERLTVLEQRVHALRMDACHDT